MKKILTSICALVLAIAAGAQTLHVKVGNVTYLFPASQTGDMTYADGTALTVMGKTFVLSEVSGMMVDDTPVTDNQVDITYNDTSAVVTVAGNVAQYVTPTVSGAYVTIEQSNTDAVDGDEITYQLSGKSADGQFALSGLYKCTIALSGVDLTCASGPAINIANKKRIQLSAKRDTENTLADCTGGVHKGCIYSKGQLQLQGNGTLNVIGNTEHAIKSADYIEVKNLTLNIANSVSDGINCNGYFQMESGTLTMTGIGDEGIQCDLDGTTATAATDDDHTDEDTGSIYIDGGTLTVTGSATAAKCVKAEGDIVVSGGAVMLNADGDIDLTDTSDISYTAGFKADGGFTLRGGDITIVVNGAAGRGIACEGVFATASSSTGVLTITNKGATSSSSTYFCTAKGIKAGEVAINGGTINVAMAGAASKGIKADSGNMVIDGGVISVECTGAGATDQTASDGKGCAGLDADYDMTISGGTITLLSTGTGGKGLKCDSTLTITGGVLNATASGGNYSSGSYSASAKAIKAGTRVATGESGSTSGSSNRPGRPGGSNTTTYTYSGGLVVNGGTIIAIAKSHEAIESKSTITITDGYVYAESSDDAINSGSDFTISGGYVMGNSTGNDALDANGNFYVKGGNVFAVAASSPEVGFDANTEGGYKLYVTGGNVVAIGGLESGSSLSGVTSKSASYSKGSWYAFQSGGATQFHFKVPSNSRMPSKMTIISGSTPSVSTASSVTGNIWNGYGQAD